MKFDIGGIFAQIVSFYTRLPLAQKIALPLLFAASMGVIVFVSQWATKPQYAVLFSRLDGQDASGIVERLKDMKINYRISKEGEVVEITPPEMVHELRIQLAGLGLPKGGNIGFELWDDSKLGETAVGEAVKWVRSLQGELERTIQSIDSVKAVRVHITNPKRSVFATRDSAPTASVLLQLKAGAELSQVQIKGIANLVAGSVERLSPENVTILDQSGNLLNEKSDEAIIKGADVKQLEYQRSVEGQYVKRIETMLAEILGPGRAVARVMAELDLNRFEKEEEQYDPSGTVTRSERDVEEKAGLTAEGGVPGVVANLTNAPGTLTPPDSSKNNNTRRESVKNYEISRAVSKTVGNPGKITRLSVAVLVDGQYVEVPATGAEAAAGKTLSKQYKPLSAEMLRKIDNLVKQAVGFDGARGDAVTVENIRFVEPDQEVAKALEEAGKMDFARLGMQYAAPLLVVIFFFFMIIRPLVKFLTSPAESEVDLSRLLPAGIQELETELEAERSKFGAIPDIEEPAIDIEELEELLSENSRMVKDNPQQAALLIRHWLTRI